MPSWNLYGQDHLLSALERGLSLGQLSHAYLLVGPPQVGKGTLAMKMAQALNCLQDSPPCGECASCSRVQRGIHADVQVIAPAADERTGRMRSEIGIDQVRDMEHAAALGAYEGKYRVFIIDGVEKMSLEASNALLKTLEEPPSGVIFLLLSSREDDLLSTIRSRCQRLEVKSVPEREMVELLVSEHSLGAEDAELLARLSAGRLGWALAAAREPRILGERQQKLDDLMDALKGGAERRFRISQELASLQSRDRRAVQETLALWLSWWRDLLMLKEGKPDLVANRDCMKALDEKQAEFSTDQVVAIIKETLATKERLMQNASPRLALDVLMLLLPESGRIGSSS